MGRDGKGQQESFKNMRWLLEGSAFFRLLEDSPMAKDMKGSGRTGQDTEQCIGILLYYIIWYDTTTWIRCVFRQAWDGVLSAGLRVGSELICLCKNEIPSLKTAKIKLMAHFASITCGPPS